MRKKYLILSLSFFMCFPAFSQIAEKLIRKGNSQYNSGSYKDAEVTYRKALTKDSTNVKGNFNLGDAIYKQANYDDAIKTFNSLLENNNLDKSTKAKIYHNLGNAYLKSKKYTESIEAYKNALRNNSTDADTKYNLSYAMKMLQKQQQQKQNQDKDKNKQDSTKNNKDSTQTKQDTTKQKQQPKKDQISKSDAERMLDALNNKDKSLQDKLKEQKVVKVKATNQKDW
jgi:Ca-activated chloride channel homolog